MPDRLPDEFFRDQQAASPGIADPEQRPVAAPSPSEAELAPSQPVVSTRVAVGVLVGALLVGFLTGRVVGALAPSPTPSPSVAVPSGSPGASPSALPDAVPYAGPVMLVPAIDAWGDCGATSSDSAENLVDSNPRTVWRCDGDGVGQTIRFTMASGSPLVGVRVVNGNTARGYARYAQERRVLSLRWTFPDGSWLVQGLAASDREPQELRFPPVPGQGQVELTILDVTAPGEPDAQYDAVTISQVDFLGAT